MNAKLIVLGSSSSGNSYILDVGDEILLIECGVDKKTLLRGLNYDLARVTACISTHKHKDHVNPQTVKYLLSSGIKVYSNADVNSIHPSVRIIEPMKKYTIGGFNVIALPVEHNVECYAYLIDHPDMGRLVFYTDTRSFNFKIPHVNFVLGEVNYSDDIILDNLCNGYDVRSQYNNHMSLDTAISVIRRLYSHELSKVICCHLSTSNADISEIKRRFQSELGISVECATTGVFFELKSCEF